MSKLPSGWELRTIGELINFAGGSQPPRSTFSNTPNEGYIRLIQIRDYRTDDYKTYIPKRLARKFCDENDIMIGRYGPPIFQIFKGLAGAYNVALIKATPTKYVLKQYAWHFLRNPFLHKFVDSLSQRSSGQTGIEMDELKDYPFPLPSIEEQKQICKALDCWDNAIGQTEKFIAAKRSQKKGFMQKLLTGKVRFPEFVRHDGKHRTRFGEYPVDWDYVQVGEIASEVSERNKAGDAIPVLSCTKHDGLVDSLGYFGKRVFAEDTSGYKIVRRGQFAYATNHIEEGSIGLLEKHEAGLISPIYAVFAVSDKIYAPFLYRLFKTELYRHIFEANTNASVDRRGSLRWNQFATISVPVPSLEEQKKVSAFFDKLDLEIRFLSDELDALRNQKKGLMQKLLTGKIRVTNTTSHNSAEGQNREANRN